MKRSINGILIFAIALAIMALVAPPVQSQDKPADYMKILLDKVKADKKLLVAANMDLTESEAKAFWPVYDSYQKDLMAINQRIGRLIENYAKDYEANTLTDDKAKALIDELVAIEQAEGNIQASYVPKLIKALPPKKVARYLQIENKIRAVLEYELAANIPLVP